jgi:hypothetical protein
MLLLVGRLIHQKCGWAVVDLDAVGTSGREKDILKHSSNTKI